MHEDYFYWNSGATVCHVVLAHIWLGLVCATVRKKAPSGVSLLPLSLRMWAENKAQRGIWPYLARKR